MGMGSYKERSITQRNQYSSVHSASRKAWLMPLFFTVMWFERTGI